ncbi:hypothetical protein DN051_02785 [Streptomyces cadmiisoli]|uniref:Uncharacterized protein n=1 Tax=Streptomyces cadmiisoli TaxID=2184053 RepID=A0A2Z4ISI7_9ACTN|nr:hypothetical protein DN051_02785 [Streptomyces cadmiisoli]
MDDETLWNPSNGADRRLLQQVEVFEQRASGGHHDGYSATSARTMVLRPSEIAALTWIPPPGTSAPDQ